MRKPCECEVNIDPLEQSELSVLVMDDDREFSEELADALRFHGFKVSILSDGRNAVKEARLFMPDAILLDLNMRPLNGFEIAAALKNNEDTKNIPILSLSGYYKGSDHWFVPFQYFNVCLQKGEALSHIINELRQAVKK